MNVRLRLMLLFAVILVGMLAVTTYASLERAVWAAGSELLSDRWFQATLADAYFGFLTFYVWVAYKEPGLWRRLAWFLLIMLLGNIAMSVYVLIQLARWDAAGGLESLLCRTAPKSADRPG